MALRTALVGVLALLLVTAGAATMQSTSQVGRRDGSCRVTIQAVGYEGIRATAQIVAAVRRGVPRIFRDFRQQGRPGWHHYQVEGLFSLNGGYSRSREASVGTGVKRSVGADELSLSARGSSSSSFPRF